MAFNGSGQFSQTNGLFSGDELWRRTAETNENVRADRFDAFSDDIKDGFEGSLQRNGENAATANLPMGTYRHTGVGDGEDRTDYAAYGQLRDAITFVAAGQVAGTASAITLAPEPTFASWPTGGLVLFLAEDDIEANATVALNAIAAVNIVRHDGGSSTVQVVAGDIQAGELVALAFDGTAAHIAWTGFGRLRPSQLASGTPALGQVPTIQSDGSLAFAAGGGAYDIFTGSGASTTIADGDLFAFADISGTGEPNAHATAAQVRTYMQATSGGTATDIFANYSGQTSVLADTDRLIVGDDSTAGDDTQYVTALNARAYMGGGFNLSDHVGTAATTFEDDDRILLAAESVAGDPNRYMTAANARAYMGGGFDIHEHIPTSATIAAADRIAFSDEGASGDPMRWTTAALARAYFGGGFDIHDHVATASTIADADRFAFSDESTSGDPMRYAQASDVRSYMLGDANNIRVLTEAQFQAITTPDANTVYLRT